MQKFLLTLAVCWATAFTAKSQTYFSENFNSGSIPASFTLYNVDGLTVATPVATAGFTFGTNAWIASSATTTTLVPDTAAYSTSYYTPAGTSNDWMVTSAIAIPVGSNAKLTWRGKSYGNTTYLEEYEVRIGTVNSVASLGLASALKLSVTNEPGVWTNHTISLASFAGQTIYIAFRNNSVDQFVMAIDDILVQNGADDIGITAATFPSEYTSIPLSQATVPFNTGVTLTNIGGNNATGVAVNLQVKNLTTSTIINTQTLTGATTLAGAATATYTGTTVSQTGIGAYEFRYICSMTQTDANRANDTIYRYVLVDNNLYARDQAIIYGSPAIIGGAGPGNGVTGELAQKYTLTNASNISIDTVFSFFRENRVGARYRAKIYTGTTSGPGVLVGTSQTYTVVPADTVGGQVGLVSFAFTPPLSGAIVGDYFVSIEQMDTFNYSMGYSKNIFTSDMLYYNVAGGAWGSLTGTSFANSFIIWPHLKSSCSLVAAGNGVNSSCGNSNGSATLTLTGNTGSSTYAWSNGTTTAALTNVAAGTYICTVTNAGCTDTAKVVITNTNTPLTVTPTSTNTTCGLSNGTANVGTQPTGSTYIWNNSATTASLTALAAGTYTVTVNYGTCSGSATTNVNASTVHTVSTTTTSSSCGGATGTATATVSPAGSYTYLWSNSQTSATATGLTAASYTVTVSGNGCSATASANVSNAGGPTASAVVTTPLSCFGGNNAAATVTATGGTGLLTYLWSNSGTTTVASNLTAGNYTVTVKDASNCLAIASAQVTSPSQISANASAIPVTCFGGNNGSAGVIASGGTGTLTYLWSNGGTTNTISSLTATSYTVTVKDGNNCSVTTSSTVSSPSKITATATSSTLACHSQNTATAMVSASGGTGTLSYTWSNSNTSSSLTGLAANTYTVTVKDANNCSASATTTIADPAQIVASATATQVNCFGGNTGSATVSATGGTGTLSYVWTPGGATSATVSTLATGTYSVAVKDANNCTASASATVTQPTAALSATTTQTSNTATVTAAGGTSPYTYSWSNGQTNATVTGLTSGSFTVTVKDSKGCTTTKTIVISGIQNVNTNVSKLNVYPNPTTGSFTVEVKMIEAEDLTISMVDMIGQNVFTSYEGNVSSLTKKMQLNELAKGVYLIQFQTKSGLSTQRLVIE